MLWNKKVTLSPEVLSATVQGSQVPLTLSLPLRADGPLYEFEVAGADGVFVNAEATRQGRQIIVTSTVAAPKIIRYAWKNNPIRANVYATNNLPMSPWQIKL